MRNTLALSFLIAGNGLVAGCGSSGGGGQAPTESSSSVTTVSSATQSSESSQSSESTIALDEFASTRYEAEFTELLGGASVQITPTASAGKYLDIPIDLDNGLRFSAQSAAQSLRIAYTANSAGSLTLGINNMPVTPFSLTPSEKWQTATHNIAISEGDEISLYVASDDIAVALDYIELNPLDTSLQAFEQVTHVGTFIRDKTDHILLDKDNQLLSSNPRIAGPLHYLSELGLEDTIFADARGIVGIAYNRMGELYAADFVGGTIFKRDVDGNESVVMDGLDKPTGITFNADNEMFVSLFGNSSTASIVRIDETEGTIEHIAQHSEMTTVIGLASDDAGMVYASTWETGTLYSISQDGTISRLAQISGVSNANQNGINQMAYSHDYLYVTAGSPRRIHRIHSQTGEIETIDETLLALDSASEENIAALSSVGGSLAISADGETLFFATPDEAVYSLKRHDNKYRFVSTLAQVNREVDGSQVTPEGDLLLGGGAHTKILMDGTVESESFDGQSGLGMDYDSTGNLYFANWGDRAIYKVNGSGALTTWASNANYPNSVFVKNDNEIYAAMCGNNWQGNNVTKFDAQGNVLSNIIINDANNSCVTSVTQSPEGVLFAANWRRGTITRIEDDVPTPLATITNDSGTTANINHIVYADGAIYAPSRNTNLIYKVSESGEVSIFSGTTSNTSNTSQDGHIDTADFGSLMNIAVAHNQDALYTVEDNGNVKVISSYKLPTYP